MSEDPRRGVVKSVDAIELKPDPIHPAWVLEGSPQARVGLHSRNVDQWAATWVWDCTAGRFNWHFTKEETVMILEGEVKVTNRAGDTYTLGVGSVGYFPGGTWWEWEVPNYVRKLAFHRQEVPSLARFVGKVLMKLRLA